MSEIASLVSDEGRMSVQELVQSATSAYGADRASEQAVFNALQRCLAESRFGYASTEDDTIQLGMRVVVLDGFVGRPEPLPPDTRVIRFTKTGVSPIDLAKVIQATTSLSKLGESDISLDVRLELKGEINEYAVTMALNEIKQRVPGLKVEEVKGE